MRQRLRRPPPTSPIPPKATHYGVNNGVKVYFGLFDNSTLIWAGERWWTLEDGEDLNFELVKIQTPEEEMFSNAVEAFTIASFANLPDHVVEVEAGMEAAINVVKEFYNV